MTISSAKNDILTLGGGLGSMSLIIKMKRVGLKTDPCGKPFFGNIGLKVLYPL